MDWEQEAMSYYKKSKPKKRTKKKRSALPRRISYGPPGYYQKPQVIYIQQTPRKTRTRKPKQESQPSLYKMLTSKKAKATYKEAGQLASEGGKVVAKGASKVGGFLKEKLFKKKSIYD